MVICLTKFISLIKKCRIEDKVYLLVDQPAYMAVCQLGGIAFGLTWNGFDSKLVNLPV